MAAEQTWPCIPQSVLHNVVDILQSLNKGLKQNSCWTNSTLTVMLINFRNVSPEIPTRALVL